MVFFSYQTKRESATSSENLVTSAQFLAALATSGSQFRALKCGASSHKTILGLQTENTFLVSTSVLRLTASWDHSSHHSSLVWKVI